MCYDVTIGTQESIMPREKIDWFTVTDDDVHRRESALKTLLESMDVPLLRLDTTNLRHLRWLSRNLGINNSEAPLFNTTCEILGWLLRWHDIGKFKTNTQT